MKSKEGIIVTLIALFLFTFMTTGYAIYNMRDTVTGAATFEKNGKVYISSAILSDYANLENPGDPTYEDTKIGFNLTFNVARTQEALEADYYVSYLITITNDSFYDYAFQTTTFTPTINSANAEDIELSYEIEGIENNEIIASSEFKTFKLIIRMVPNNVGEYNISGETDFELEPETQTGSILGSIPKNLTIDLKNNNSEEITATIINTYETEMSFHITTSNSNFYLTDRDGNELSEMALSINANVENTYPILVKKRAGARFATEKQTINIFLEPTDGNRMSMGVVTIIVEKDNSLVDTEPPTIGNVVGSLQPTRGAVLVTYNGNDNIGISHYIIETYKGEELVATNQTDSDIQEYTVVGLQDGTYHFKVQAVDTSGLTSSSESSSEEYRWTMSVNINITQGGPNGTYTVDYGETYSTTITANTNRIIPTNLTIVMGSETLSNNQYTYNNTNGNLTIPNVTGDISITGATSGIGCLIEGTKVLLANKKEKNIEDISYDDLLLVWNYETGTVTKEYPIWIEKGKTTNQYIKITFSDKSEIKVYGHHAFFEADQKKFINYQTDLKLGTKVKKINSKNQLKTVTVTKIEEIKETVNYYFVASTRYYNIIANNFITTDGYTAITNLYEFDDSIKWSDNREIKELDYQYLEDVLPYYLYKGFRAGELAVLLNKKETSINQFKNYITNLITNSKMQLEPITKNNKHYWTVSFNNHKKALTMEGTQITLPKSKTKRWYSTAENKWYKENDKVTVWTGMHFEEK